MTPQEARGAVSRWLRIRAETGYAAQHPANSAEADHSALLGRLLEGKEPLAFAPPTAYAYPWYDLFDRPFLEWTMDEPWVNPHDPSEIVIAQGRWHVEETLSDGWRVSHERLPGRIWRLTKAQVNRGTLNGPREFPGWHLEEEHS